MLNDYLSETFGEITWKYKTDELIDKSHNTLNELTIRNDLVKTIELSNELLETLKIIKNCSSCKDNMGHTAAKPNKVNIGITKISGIKNF